MNFFSNRTGRMVLVPDVGFPLTVGLEGWPGGVPMKSVITSASIASQGSFQFMQSLRNLIYVYVFGEKIGEIEIGGISFAGECSDRPSPTGLENVWRYYLQHRISNRGSPISVAIGVELSFRGWLTAFRVGVTDPNSGLSQFSMRFNFFPGRLVTNPDKTTDFLLPETPQAPSIGPLGAPISTIGGPELQGAIADEQQTLILSQASSSSTSRVFPTFISPTSE